MEGNGILAWYSEAAVYVKNDVPEDNSFKQREEDTSIA
jgi:hypothetical protein